MGRGTRRAVGRRQAHFHSGPVSIGTGPTKRGGWVKNDASDAVNPGRRNKLCGARKRPKIFQRSSEIRLISRFTPSEEEKHSRSKTLGSGWPDLTQ